MIYLSINKRDFEYDVYSLTKAFFSKEEVAICYSCEPEHTIEQKKLDREEKERREQREFKKNREIVEDTENIENSKQQETDKILEFIYEENRIKISLFQEEELITEKEIQIDYYQNRKETKNYLKRLLYEILNPFTGKELPWGTLTGIRPTKIPVSLIEGGMSNAQTAEYLRATYLMDNKKVALSIATANRELDILSKFDYKKGYSLYVGIPFCPSICLYCSFSSYPLAMWESKVDAYLQALYQELKFIGEVYKDKPLHTIYIGGGTPTTLSPRQMDQLLSVIEENFSYENLQELTVEAGRPDSVTREKLEVLKQHKVSRISVNPQTMNQTTLDIIGRRHTVEQTKEAFWLAREMGFDNINMDLIVGLPKEGLEEVTQTMEELTLLMPDSVTVHSLAVKRAARLNIQKEDYQNMSFVNTDEIMELTVDYTRKMGLSPYYLYRQKNMTGNFENVGYAKVDKAGIYNILIMEEKHSIIAAGAGASTKLVFQGEDRIERVENVKDVTNYIERIDEMIDRKRQAMT